MRTHDKNNDLYGRCPKGRTRTLPKKNICRWLPSAGTMQLETGLIHRRCGYRRKGDGAISLNKRCSCRVTSCYANAVASAMRSRSDKLQKVFSGTGDVDQVAQSESTFLLQVKSRCCLLSGQSFYITATMPVNAGADAAVVVRTSCPTHENETCSRPISTLPQRRCRRCQYHNHHAKQARFVKARLVGITVW